MMLQEWRIKNNVTYRKMSVDMDLSYTTIYHLLIGKDFPNGSTIRKIITYTHGEVTFEDMAKAHEEFLLKKAKKKKNKKK